MKDEMRSYIKQEVMKLQDSWKGLPKAGLPLRKLEHGFGIYVKPKQESNPTRLRMMIVCQCGKEYTPATLHRHTCQK